MVSHAMSLEELKTCKRLWDIRKIVMRVSDIKEKMYGLQLA